MPQNYPYSDTTAAPIQRELDRVCATTGEPRMVLTGKTYTGPDGAVWRQVSNPQMGTVNETWVTDAYGADQGAVLPDETLSYGTTQDPAELYR